MSQYQELSVDKIVNEWAADLNESTAKSQNREKPKFDYKRDYSRVKFIDDIPEFDVRTRHANDGPSAEILYEEIYRNDTNRQQMFSLKLSRQTMSVGRIDLSNALVMDGQCRIRMRNLPDEVPITAGFGSEINFQDTGVHEMKESLSWSVDTQVKVPKKSTVTATVSVTEKTHESHFKINTRIRGNVHCDVINLNTGEYTSHDGDIITILQNYAKGTPGLSFTSKQAVFQSKGYCSFRFGIEKHVSLEEESADLEDDIYSD